MSSSAGRILVPFASTEIAGAPAPATGREIGRPSIGFALSACAAPRGESILSLRRIAAAPLRL